MSKHTKGPWMVAETNRRMTCVYTEDTNIALLVHKSDAHLISAAPDLLEACKAIMKARDSRLIEVDGPYYKALELCHEAIAKAEGA